MTCNVCRYDARGSAQARARVDGVPVSVQLEYYMSLRRFVDSVHEDIKRKVYPVAKAASESINIRTDARKDPELEAKLEKLAREIIAKAEGPSKALPRKVLKEIEAKQREHLNRRTRKAVGVDLIKSVSPEVARATKKAARENSKLIKSIPKRYLAAVNRKVLQAVESGTRWETLAKDLEETYGTTKARARLIATDQVGKYYGKLNQFRQQEIGVKRYTWRTSGDSRVRPVHVKRNGKKYNWSQPPEGGHPGQDIACRCDAIADMTAIERRLDKPSKNNRKPAKSR